MLTWQAYTPRRGESLKKIARKFAIGVRELREANGLHSSQQIHARHAVLVPMGKVNNAQNGDLHHISTLLEAANEHAASRWSISAK